MRAKTIKIIVFVAAVVAGVALWKMNARSAAPGNEVTREIQPVIGSVQNVISSTGTVLPKNRLEVKPSVSGRVEEILVREGQGVQAGQTLAWMSSTERAALLDAARGQNEEALRYWQEVYKAIPLISPINGEVIVAKTQPGQTVTTADPVLVLSDQLIVRAQVDETDIGKIKDGQRALLHLDAYPDIMIPTRVEHIYYESKTINNVTIYEVDLLPQEVPEFFRSGMNATVDFLAQSKDNVLLIPAEAVLREKNGNFVLVKDANGQSQQRPVQLGISDDKNVEVLSGLDAYDTVIVKTKKYTLPKSNVGANPLMPIHNQRRSSQQR
ncbi:MAG: HlyD family efflux transporter periplasmic adaptor subunit [Candidatus Omnitrophica bacterium]|nr:HlyD family efflux transporter periplasmic adaptor subunit [Candidatus Omnitrophota bacterium]